MKAAWQLRLTERETRISPAVRHRQHSPKSQGVLEPETTRTHFVAKLNNYGTAPHLNLILPRSRNAANDLPTRLTRPHIRWEKQKQAPDSSAPAAVEGASRREGAIANGGRNDGIHSQTAQFSQSLLVPSARKLLAQRTTETARADKSRLTPHSEGRDPRRPL